MMFFESKVIYTKQLRKVFCSSELFCYMLYFTEILFNDIKKRLSNNKKDTVQKVCKIQSLIFL